MDDFHLATALIAVNLLWLIGWNRILEERYVVALHLWRWALPWVVTAATVTVASPAAMPIATIGLLSITIDARRNRLPLELTGVMLVETVLLLMVSPRADWQQSLGGVGVWLLPLVVGAMAGGVGWGDVLFAAPLGLWMGSLGGTGALISLSLALAGTVVWVRGTRNGHRVSADRVPFGPFLWGGAITTWLAMLGMDPHLSLVCGKLEAC